MDIFWFISLLLALTVHEYAHARVADRLGDPTARLAGRLSLNPLRHLDLMGTLFLLVTKFGWGKPVPIDPFNLRNPRRDQMLISLAGPLTNFATAILIALVSRVFVLFLSPDFTTYYLLLATSLVAVNLSLGLFNLLPIYPLDGFHVVTGLLPENKAAEWQSTQNYGWLILLAVMFLPLTSGRTLLDLVLIPMLRFLINLLL